MNENMLAGCEFPTPQAAAQNTADPPSRQKFNQLPEAETPDCTAFFKRIDGQLFIDSCATKFDLRHFNVLAVKDLQIVFVSTFQELYGAPFLAIHPQFKGKIFMTQPMHQIGQNLLLEFVRLNKKRNSQKAQQINFFEQE